MRKLRDFKEANEIVDSLSLARPEEWNVSRKQK
jgi:hypothetical protein